MMQQIVSHLAEVLSWAGPGVCLPTSWLVYTNRGQKRSSLLVFVFPAGSPNPQAIVKLSRDTASIAREFSALERLSHRLPERVPRPYLHGDIQGFGYLAMEAVAADAPTPVAFAGLLPEVLRGLILIHDQVAEGVMSHDVLGWEVLAPLCEFERTWATHHRDLTLLCSSVRRRLETLMHVELRQLPQHGDFCVDNLLVRPDGRIVVIDWEEFGSVRLPAYDLITLFASVEPRGDEDARLRLLSDTLEVYGKELSIDREWLAVLVPLALMRFVLFCGAESRHELIQVVMSQLRALTARSENSGWRLAGWS